jgi:hypothetical protein
MTTFDGSVVLQVLVPVHGIEANTAEEAETEAEILAVGLLADAVDSIDGEDIEVTGVEVWDSEDAL